MILKGKIKRFPETNLPISQAIGETAEIEIDLRSLGEQVSFDTAQAIAVYKGVNKSSPKEFLKQSRKIHQDIWDKQDIKSMALECIDFLCYAIEDGMNKDKALELIYVFSHCSQDSICYDSHED